MSIENKGAKRGRPKKTITISHAPDVPRETDLILNTSEIEQNNVHLQRLSNRHHKHTKSLKNCKNKAHVEKKVLELYIKGLTHNQILKLTNIAHETLQKIITKNKSILDAIKDNESIKHLKADLIDATILKSVQSCYNKVNLDKTTCNQAAYTASRLYEMHRLETNKSTQNIGIMFTSPPDLGKIK